VIGLLKKLRSINRRDRKGFTQSSQRPDGYRDHYKFFIFAHSALLLPTEASAQVGFACFAVKETFSTALVILLNQSLPIIINEDRYTGKGVTAGSETLLRDPHCFISEI
jgi:hypothetical protein